MTRRENNWPVALAFLAPNFIGFMIFMFLPIAFSLVMAFTNWQMTETVPLQFVGVDNFKDLLTDSRFWYFFGNTLYLMLGIPVSIIGSLLLATILSQKLQGVECRVVLTAAISALTIYVLAKAGVLAGIPEAIAPVPGAVGVLALCAAIVGGYWYAAGPFTHGERSVVLFRTMFYLPTVTSGVALFIMWKAIYNPEFGPLNTMLRSLLDASGAGGEPPDWLLSIAWAKPAIMLMGVWTAIGGTNMLLYLAGISNIPPELYEAAQIDGAGRWSMFRHVTWPQLMPTTFFIVVMSCIGGLQGGFEQARVMTRGGPAESTVTLGYYIYMKGFEEYQLGYASTIAWVMFVLIFLMTLMNWKFGKSAFELDF